MNRNPRIQVPDGRDLSSVNRPETSDRTETDAQTGGHAHVAVAGDQRMADSSAQHQPKVPGPDEDHVQDTDDRKSPGSGEHREVDKSGDETEHVHNGKWPYYYNDRDVAARDILHTTNNYFGALADVDAKSISRRPSLLDKAALRRRVEVTVPPDGLVDYVDELKRERLLVLTCPPRRQEGTGCGQNSAAIWLLWNIIGDDSVSLKDPSVHKLHLDSVNGNNEHLLDALESSISGSMFLVDLVDAPKSQLDRAVDDLGNIAKVLHDNGAFLVISAPSTYADQFGRNLPGRVCELQRPDPVAVLRQNLRGFDDQESETLLSDSQLGERLRLMWPARVLEVAEWANTSRSQGKPVEEVLCDLENAQQDWSQDLDEALDHEVDAWQRCLLLAAAVLEGADASAVVESAWLLIKVTKYDLSRPHALDEKSAKSELSFPQQIPFQREPVQFRAPGMAAAIPAHVWSHYRPLREHLRRWLITMPKQQRWLEGRDLNSIVDSIAVLAQRHDHKIAIQVAEAWITYSSKKDEPQLVEPQRSMAVRLLSNCASDGKLGFKVRECLYRWVHDRNDPRFAVIIAQVCATSYGTLFPGSALTRLKHAARHENSLVEREVVTALLAISDSIGIAELSRQLTAWTTNTQPHAVSVLVKAYDRLLAQFGGESWDHDSQGTHSALAQVLSLWDTLDRFAGSRVVAPLIRQWFQLVALAPRQHADDLMNLLVNKIGVDTRRAGQLFLAINPAVFEFDEPQNRYDELRMKVHNRFYEARVES